MRKTVTAGITAILLLMALASGFLLLSRQMQYRESEKGLTEIRTAMDAAGLYDPAGGDRGTVTENGDAAPEEEENKADAGQIAKDLPEELLGRLLVPTIETDLPVMRPPKEDPEKYLTRDALGNASAYGSVFADPAANDASGCLVLYGHHMKNGAMFGNIGKLSAKDPVTLVTPEGVYGYAVIAAFTVTPVEAEAAGALSLLTDADAEKVASQAEKTGTIYERPDLNKRHLALVTCEYERPGEKLVVLCEEP